MRTKLFFKNTFILALQFAFSLIVGIIVPRIFIANYGDQTVGLTNSIFTFAEYFTLIEAGFGGAYLFALYKPLAQENHEDTNKVVSTANTYYKKLALLLLGIYIAFAFVYPLIVDSSITYLELVLLVLLVALPSLINFAFINKYSFFLNANREVYIFALATIIEKSLYLLFAYLLATNGFSIFYVYAALSVLALLKVILLKLYIKRKHSYLKITLTTHRETIKSQRDTFLTAIAAKVAISVPVIMTTIVLTVDDVTILSVFSLVVVGISSLLSIFTTGLEAALGELFAKNELDTLKRVNNEFEYLYVFITTLAYSLLVILLLPFINLYVGTVGTLNYNRMLFGILFVLSHYFNNLKTPAIMLIYAAGKYRELRTANIVYIVISLVLSSLFGYFFGLEGVAIGMIISNFFRFASSYYIAHKHTINVNYKQTIKRVITSLLLIAALYSLYQLISLSITSYLIWFVVALVVGAICLLVTLGVFILIDRTTFKDVVSMIKQRLHRKTKNVS